MLNEKQKVIIKLISQHRELSSQLLLVKEIYESKNANKISLIISLLETFSALLKDHLALEESAFYSKLLASMKTQQEDTAEVEKFMQEMLTIGTAVIDFLKRYEDEMYFTQNSEKFGFEFEGIVTALTSRILKEESGVYSYWSLSE